MRAPTCAADAFDQAQQLAPEPWVGGRAHRQLVQADAVACDLPAALPRRTPEHTDGDQEGFLLLCLLSLLSAAWHRLRATLGSSASGV